MTRKLLFVALTCLPFYVRSQNTDTLRFENKKAITFSFSGFYLGGGLGGKYYLNNWQFIRVQVTGSYQTDKSDRPLVDSSISNSDSKQTGLGITFGLATRFENLDGFLPYCGLDVGYRWNSSRYSYTSLSGKGGSEVSEEAFIGGLYVGVEYFASQRFSLSGEQRIELTWARGSGGYTRFVLRNSTSSLLLSVYL